MDLTPPVPIELLERQQRAGARRLRFMPELEPSYLAERADAIVARRLALIVAALVIIGITPAFNAFVLHAPEGFNGPALLTQFGLMTPALLLAALSTGWRRLRRWQDPLAALGAIAVSAGLLIQRHIGAAYGFAVPIELVSVVLLGAAVLGGLRWVWFLPTAVAIDLAFAFNEITTFGSGPSTVNQIFGMTVMAAIAAIGSYMEETGARAEWLHRRLAEERAAQDALTGLSNARAFGELYPRLHAAAVRDGKSLLVALVDIDYFKNYNDRYGHLAGDECLRRVAQVLPRHARRATDLLARIGGEEFALVWHDMERLRGEALLETLRAEVERLQIPHAARPAGPGAVTVSIGAAWLTKGLAPAGLLEAADRQLYASKEAGRNRVSMA